MAQWFKEGKRKLKKFHVKDFTDDNVLSVANIKKQPFKIKLNERF